MKKLFRKLFGRSEGFYREVEPYTPELLSAEQASERASKYGHTYPEELHSTLSGIRLDSSIGLYKRRLYKWEDYSDELKKELVTDLEELGYKVIEDGSEWKSGIMVMYVVWGGENYEEK